MNISRHSARQHSLALVIWLFFLLQFSFLSNAAHGQQPDIETSSNYLKLAQSISASHISGTIAALSGITYVVPGQESPVSTISNSRLAGTPGCDQARDYVKSQFTQIFGARNVSQEDFAVTIPVDRGAYITAGKQSFEVRCLWPNLVRTSTLPREGVTGPLIYAGQGDLKAFRGKKVDGSIVMLDFNCGTRWLNASRLGAKAVIFVEPGETMRGEAEGKFVSIPASIPRFWISRGAADSLQSAALTSPDYTITVHAYNPWEMHTASNLIGVIPGSDPVLGKQIIVIESYYDSMSVVPSLAPGAEQACGIASLLELARAFHVDPPKRTVWFVATGGHFLGLKGARTYVDRHLHEWQPVSLVDKFKHLISFGQIPLPANRQEVLLFSGLDISSQSSTVGAFYKGFFYDYREDVQGDYTDLGHALSDNAVKIIGTLGLNPDNVFDDCLNQKGGRDWRTYLNAHLALDAEAATLAGGYGISFATTDDSRTRTDTPYDTAGAVNIANVTQQTKFLACEYWNLLNDTNDPSSLPDKSLKSVVPIKTWPGWTRQGLRFGYSTVDGSVLLFDPKASFVPNKPITDSLAVISHPTKTMSGVRGSLVEATYTPSASHDPGAHFRFTGLPLIISSDPSQNGRFAGGLTSANCLMRLSAFHIHDSDDALGHRGDVDYAPDKGVNGDETYPTDFTLMNTQKDTQVIVFPCVATSIYDLIDQGAFRPLAGLRIFDGATDGEPRQYGYMLGTSPANKSSVEDISVLFSDTGENTRLKVVMDSGPADVRFLLINALPPDEHLSNSENQQRAQGLGYAVGAASARNLNYTSSVDPNNPNNIVRNGAITNTALRVAQDMWNIDEFRIHQLTKYRIVNEMLSNPRHTGLHDTAYDFIQKAITAYHQNDYEAFDSYSRQAWAYESRVYPQAQSTANDVVRGVIFYLFLLIPFSYFLERLLIASSSLIAQLRWSFLFFIGIYIVFSKIHPAFDITVNPIIVLIAFVMLALSVIVSLVVWGKFEEQLKDLRKTISGVHKADVGKASIAFAAFMLGISNMRRRKERTLLTCITLVFLTFTVLSFTSVVNTIRYNDLPGPGHAAYNGILLRTPNWEPLEEPAYRFLNDEYGGKYTVAPRAWFYNAPIDQPGFVRITRAQKSVNLTGVAGLTPNETLVSHIDTALLTDPQGKTLGRWFNASDTYSAIIPKEVADAMGITAGGIGKATIDFAGEPYIVVGIFDSAKFASIKDVDDEPMMPADNALITANLASAKSQSGFTVSTHLNADNIILVPYRTLMNSGGNLRSVAINFNSAKTVSAELKQLMPRLDLNIYAGENGVNHRFSAVDSSKSEGFLQVLIPIIIAGLIVLNTMLGSVFERIKEIKTFASIGLSPQNIGMLFIAEAVVYGIIGAVSGYLIGQAVAKIISVFNILPGLTLNFSSTSAEIAIGVVILVVLLSTLFPARKASEVATPAVDRSWKVPEPEGDEWNIRLPFAVTGVQAKGINGFLSEWFKSYEEQSIGDLLTQGISYGTITMGGGIGYRLSGRVWLAPFDLGVSQDIILDTRPTDLEDIYEVHLLITRISGEASNWKRINRRFLNVLRQQFLIWRTLSSAQRDHYLNAPDAAFLNKIENTGSAFVAPAL